MESIKVISPTTTTEHNKDWRPNASYYAATIEDTGIVFEDKSLATEPLIINTNDYTHWSQLKVDGVIVPGICKINIGFSRDLDNKKLKGYDWSKIKDEGANSKTIDVNIRMNAVDYHEYMENVQKIFAVKSTAYTFVTEKLAKELHTSGLVPANKSISTGILKTSDFMVTSASNLERIFNLENALLLDYGIEKAILLSMSQSTPEVGMTEIEFKFIEYQEPIKRPARPTKDAAGGVKAGGSDILPKGNQPYVGKK